MTAINGSEPGRAEACSPSADCVFCGVSDSGRSTLARVVVQEFGRGIDRWFGPQPLGRRPLVGA